MQNSLNESDPLNKMLAPSASEVLSSVRSRGWIVVALSLCLLPSVFGFFGLRISYVDDLAAGSIVHALLEWSSIVLAYATVILAVGHYAVKKDITTPVIGLALFFSATMDVFHVLAATHLVESKVSNGNLIPFTWAMSRSFNAIILMAGILLCLQSKSYHLNIHVRWLLLMGVVFGSVACGLIFYAAGSEELPQTQFPDGFVSRPYDVIPLCLFVLAIPLFVKLFRLIPNMITLSICLSLVPEMFLELHMAFGSTTLFDENFNAAHQLKILAYLIPFIGFSIDYMTTARNQGELLAVLQKREARLSAIVDSSIEGIITIDDSGRIESFNKASEDMFGYSENEVIGENLKVLMPEKFGVEHDNYLSRYLATGEKKIIGLGREVQAKRKDGSVFPIDLSISEMNLGENIGFSGMIRDITERKAAEEKLAETVDNLMTSNNDLEKFAYVASHDLRSPLRGIDHLSQWLIDDFDERLTQDSRVLMDKLRGRVRRMERLLDDLLAYSQIKKVPFEELEMTSAFLLASETANTIDKAERQTILLDPSLKDYFVPRMPLAQVFLNLMVNALKHNADKDCRVKISATACDEFLRITISDNGIGIAPEYHERVFEMFQTLRPRDEVEGSGMGLALVKRNLQQWNATIRLDLAEVRGASFVITWPLKYCRSLNTE